jgi:hypothetical protein
MAQQIRNFGISQKSDPVTVKAALIAKGYSAVEAQKIADRIPQ